MLVQYSAANNAHSFLPACLLALHMLTVTCLLSVRINLANSCCVLLFNEECNESYTAMSVS